VQAVLDGTVSLAGAALEVCGVAGPWVALSEVHRLFKSEPLAAPRSGFNGRFKARLAQRRSRPRLIGGAVALGLGAVGLAALVVPLGLGVLYSVWRVAQQPATALALFASAEAARSVLARRRSTLRGGRDRAGPANPLAGWRRRRRWR
jgi:hypothetical protein